MSQSNSAPFRSVTRNLGVLAICLALCTLGLARWVDAQRITTFDAPGAGAAPGQGTFAFGLTPSRVVEGEYLDASNVFHGFVRSRDGSITTFDAPGAGTGAFQGTQPVSINPGGTITGFYTDSSGLNHGFLRAPDGTMTSFDAPGAGIIGFCPPTVICGNGTQGASINPAGVIAGQYADTGGIFHGFVRSPDGTITTFDAPGAGTGPGQGTVVTFTDGINPVGAIAGGYIDSGNVLHALVRAPSGVITEFEVPGAVNGENNSGINPKGTVTSFYFDSNFVLHGYVRSPNGTFTLFDVPGAGTGTFQGTEPFNINAPGDITGPYVDGNGVNHGFLRTKHGALTKFDVTGAGTGSGQGTIPVCNNPADAISGYFIDAQGVSHGFLRTSRTDHDRQGDAGTEQQ